MEHTMAINKIEHVFDIYIDTFITDIDKAKKTFPSSSSHSYGSTYDNMAPSFTTETAYFALSKNAAEISKAHYRNGIDSEIALMSAISKGKLFIGAGEYTINGVRNYLNFLNTREYTTPTVAGQTLALQEVSTVPAISYISSSVYKRNKSSYSLIAAPKEYGKGTSITDKYLGYEFQEEPDLITINNYIQKEEFGKYSFNRSNGFAANSDEEMIEMSEYVGLADGTLDQTFKTKFFPISEFGNNQRNGEDNFTRVIVENEGSYTYYYPFHSYSEAERSGFPESCFIDKAKGKIYFSKRTFRVPEGETSLRVEVSLAPGSGQKIVPLEGKSGDLFLDTGFVNITQEGSPLITELIRFTKIDNYRIQLHNLSNSYTGAILITPALMLTPPTGKVYCCYTVVMGLQNIIKNTNRLNLNREIKPWYWTNQKTIAVISKSKLYPYKIVLKAIDTPFLGIDPVNIYSYGPILNSAELVLLEGTVLDENDQPVPETEVLVYLEEGSGLLNGMKESLVTSDDSGKFYCTYEPMGKNASWLYFKDSDIVRYGGKTRLAINADYNDLENINLSGSKETHPLIYSIVKNDGTIGTVGHPLTFTGNVLDTPAEYTYKRIIDLSGTRYSTLGNRGFFFFDGFSDTRAFEYIGGEVTLQMQTLPSFAETVTYTYKIKDIVPYPEAWYSEGTSEFYFPEMRHRLNTFLVVLEGPPGPIADAYLYLQKAFFRSNNEIPFNPSALNGKKVVISKGIDGPWTHPAVQDLTPTYGVLEAERFESENKTFIVNETLPDSSSTNRNIDIAGYALIPDMSTLIKAKALSEDDYVYSNGVKFRITLGDWDKGVATALLGQIKVPYGFRLWNYSGEDASTIGAETFLTINNIAGSSARSVKYPLISYVDSNGIIYLDTSGQPKSYKNYPVSLNFTINIQ
jgi:hypothetical protein